MNGLLASLVYLLCFLTSSACAFLLGRAHRRAPAPLLLWSAICFSFLAAGNLMLVVDLLLLPDDVDLRVPRTLLALGGAVTLLFGFIWAEEDEA